MEEQLGKCLAGPGDAAPILVTKHPSGPSRSPLLDTRSRITGAPVAPALVFRTNLSAASRSWIPMYGVRFTASSETRRRLEESFGGAWQGSREISSVEWEVAVRSCDTDGAVFLVVWADVVYQ